MGLNETDLHGLARLLSGFGVWLSVSEDGAPPQPLAGTPAAGTPPATASLVLSDGRQLQIAGPATPPPPAGEPAAPLRERRAGPEVADMRFRLLAEHSIDMIVAVDADLAIRYASPATARLLGRDPADLRGHTLADLLAHEDRAAFIARHFTRNAQRGQSVPDLFRALPWSHGTLGLLVALELRVVPAPTHVRLVYRPFFSLDEYCAEHERLLRAENTPWFLEAQVFGRDRAVILEGHLASADEVANGSLPVNDVNQWQKPFFFKHVESMLDRPAGTQVTELVPTYAFLMRHERSMCMTMGPRRPRWLRRMAMTSGPPARPRRTGAGKPSMRKGYRPSSTPSKMPAKMAANLTRSSSGVACS